MLDKILDVQVRENNLSHAYIFQSYDKDILEKQTIEFIKLVLRDKKNVNSLENFYNPDLFKIKPEGAVIKIDSIREAIKYLQTPPTKMDYKIVLIEDAEKFNKESANALLKILEEPPSYGILILTTNNEMSIIDTIYSRCQIVNFFINESNSLESWKEINDILVSCFKRDLLIMFEEKEYLNSLKFEADKFYNYLYCFFYDLYLYKSKLENKANYIIPKNINIYKKINNFSIENIYNILEKITFIFNNFRMNLNFQLSYEELLLYIMEEQNG
ncbi:MAG: hypothetical protein Q4E02_04370 [Lagierella massiliensis]|nr:hypothetical protein [Lagierella massiliensis]